MPVGLCPWPKTLFSSLKKKKQQQLFYSTLPRQTPLQTSKSSEKGTSFVRISLVPINKTGILGFRVLHQFVLASAIFMLLFCNLSIY